MERTPSNRRRWLPKLYSALSTPDSGVYWCSGGTCMIFNKPAFVDYLRRTEPAQKKIVRWDTWIRSASNYHIKSRPCGCDSNRYIRGREGETVVYGHPKITKGNLPEPHELEKRPVMRSSRATGRSGSVELPPAAEGKGTSAPLPEPPHMSSFDETPETTPEPENLYAAPDGLGEYDWWTHGWQFYSHLAQSDIGEPYTTSSRPYVPPPDFLGDLNEYQPTYDYSHSHPTHDFPSSYPTSYSHGRTRSVSRRPSTEVLRAITPSPIEAPAPTFQDIPEWAAVDGLRAITPPPLAPPAPTFEDLPDWAEHLHHANTY